MSKRIRVSLSDREVEIIGEALATYLDQQLPDECEADNDPARLARVERFAERFPHRDGRYTPDQIHEMSEACDSYLYWEVSDPQDRNDGYAYWNPDEDEEGSKMARDDREPEYVEACREVDDLARKLEALSHTH